MARKAEQLAEKAHLKEPYQSPKPDPGTPCQTCKEAAEELGLSEEELKPVEAEAYWLATDQNPDPERRLYRMDPVCDFHYKFWRALYLRHQESSPPLDEQDLYGRPDRTPDDTLTIDGLVALMSRSLNEELDRKVETLPARKRHRTIQFHDEDMIRHALQWTTNDILIMGAWAQVLSTMFEEGSFSAAGPEDVVPDDRKPGEPGRHSS